jgi:hypothetical protein
MSITVFIYRRQSVIVIYFWQYFNIICKSLTHFKVIFYSKVYDSKCLKTDDVALADCKHIIEPCFPFSVSYKKRSAIEFHESCIFFFVVNESTYRIYNRLLENINCCDVNLFPAVCVHYTLYFISMIKSILSPF